jgi:hypothetical protein
MFSSSPFLPNQWDYFHCPDRKQTLASLSQANAILLIVSTPREGQEPSTVPGLGHTIK